MKLKKINKEKAVKTKPALRLIDGATFGIYLCHILIINIINELMPSFGIDSISGRYLVRIAVVYTLSIGVCLLYRIIKERFSNRALEGKE